MVWESPVIAVNSMCRIILITDYCVSQPFSAEGGITKCFPIERCQGTGTGEMTVNMMHLYIYELEGRMKVVWGDFEGKKLGKSIVSVQLWDWSCWVSVNSVNTALLCTEVPVCPLLGVISHPDFCFGRRGFGHSCFPCPFVIGLKKRACLLKTCRPLGVTQSQSLLEAAATLPSSEVFVQHCA